MASEVRGDMAIDVHIRRRGEVAEVFINASPPATKDPAAQATAMMSAIGDVLRQHEARIWQERVFAEASCMDLVASARHQAYGSSQDAVPPTCLVVPASSHGPIRGVQVHAIAGCGRPSVLSIADCPRGRLMDMGATRYVTGCGLAGNVADAPAVQAHSMFTMAQQLLAEAGGSLRDLVRTWLWLGDILRWYDDLNQVRSRIFAAHGLLQPDATGNLPASTGIGVRPVGGLCCAMDFSAKIGGEAPRYLLGASRQGPASRYGSAFSRAAVVELPAGRTVYVSGTAAIDATGRTTHLGDARGQIRDTIENVESVLGDAGASQEDIVQAIVYCKTPEVEEIFRRGWSDWPVPYILVLADVCRDNLLFEVEATAMSSHRGQDGRNVS